MCLIRPMRSFIHIVQLPLYGKLQVRLVPSRLCVLSKRFSTCRVSQSGHSRWSTIKHGKAINDAKSMRIISKLAQEMTVATRLDGPDPDYNPRLMRAIEAGRKVSMPKRVMENAIRRGSPPGSGGGSDAASAAFETIFYEGMGPGGSALIVEANTDKRTKAAGEVKAAFNAVAGSSLTPSQFMFTRQGRIVVGTKLAREADNVGLTEKIFESIFDKAVELGAEDVSILSSLAASEPSFLNDNEEDSLFDLKDNEEDANFVTKYFQITTGIKDTSQVGRGLDKSKIDIGNGQTAETAISKMVVEYAPTEDHIVPFKSMSEPHQESFKRLYDRLMQSEEVAVVFTNVV